ncbi:glycosyltransferase family 4 protein [Mycetocola zhadangensis]|uniref:D-inositol 3-phosphate glycosyltransferase n=1 Tax=Mycetocola zhadangensis TaxID=1164595 RepID=A0A3L7J267_9MICO|nr:glycosyltransferase family 4 protein [Mycetocola zhadangensis]RLQ84570.1 glycosyltransferase [Mycetocola zhadangensis]
MHILVCPHELTVGGSQINALELAREVRDAGHRVTIYAAPDVLVSTIEEFGLDYIPAPPRKHPLDVRAINALTQTARRLGVDVVHTYEWPPSLEAAYGPTRSLGIPTVMTVLSMDVPDFLPHHLPIIVGTEGLAAEARGRGRDTHVIEPPIDVTSNHPDACENARTDLNLNADAFVTSVVGRLSVEHEKYFGVLEAIAVVDELARTSRVTLVIAGDGEGMVKVRSRAEDVNARHGADVIRVMGNLLDPRPAYAAADVVLGMGGSALRGMAFAKPLVVQGAGGFWRLLTPESQRQFLTDGFFGHGGGGVTDLNPILQALLTDPRRRSELGAFGRDLVESRFDVKLAGRRLAQIYATASNTGGQRSRAARSLATTTYEFAKFRTAMRLQSLRGDLEKESARG